MTDLTLEQKIDEILETYATYVYSEAPDFYVPAGIKYDGINKNEAKQQLLNLIQEEKIKELEMIDATRHYGKDYQESLDEVEEYLYNRLQALKQPKGGTK